MSKESENDREKRVQEGLVCNFSSGSDLSYFLMIMIAVALFGFACYAFNLLQSGQHFDPTGFVILFVLPVVWWIWRDWVKN
jgi:hypothetical protein